MREPTASNRDAPSARYALDALVGVAAISLLTLFFAPTVQLVGDVKAHVGWARQLLSGQPVPPDLTHQFFHRLVVLASRATGLPPSTTGLDVWIATYAATAGALYFYLVARLSTAPGLARALAAATLTAGLMLVGPLTFLTLPHKNVYLGYIAPNVYHNPTQSLIKPLAIALFAGTAAALAGRLPRGGWSFVFPTALAAVAGCLAKPSYALCVLPAAGFFAVARLIWRRPVAWELLLAGVLLPTLAVLVWMYVSAYGGGARSSLAWAPFAVAYHHSQLKAPGVGVFVIKQLGSILFPLLVLLLYPRGAVRDVHLGLGWLGFLAGAGWWYLFIERGPRWEHGNLGWSAQISLFLLFVASAAFVARRYLAQPIAAPTRGEILRLSAVGVALALHVGSGLVWYFVHLSTPYMSWW